VKLHLKAGLLSMVNVSKGSNGSEFFIHLEVNSCMDGTNVMFG
jgi:cyclophilin family peptidyl-prolyl cis-trans isomerase